MTTENNTPTTTETAAAKAEPELGRNEPCYCGSGKKFKRCHGVGAAPKLTVPATSSAQSPIPGFDPSAVDPAMMTQMAQMLQRLPRGQMMKLQSIMQRAMQGKDVTREAAEIQRMLPPEFAAMAQQMMMAGGMMNAMNSGAEAEMPKSEDEAKKIVAEAVAAGKISADEAKQLLGDEAETLIKQHEKKGFSKLWSKVTGK